MKLVLIVSLLVSAVSLSGVTYMVGSLVWRGLTVDRVAEFAHDDPRNDLGCWRSADGTSECGWLHACKVGERVRYADGQVWETDRCGGFDRGAKCLNCPRR